MVQLYCVRPTQHVSPLPCKFVHLWEEDSITQLLWPKRGLVCLHAVSLWKNMGCWLPIKWRKNPEKNNSLEIKTPRVLKIVNSKKCGGCKNHRLSFTSMYSIYVCCEQWSMVRVGSPVSAASHCRHASHSWGQQTPLPTDTPQKASVCSSQHWAGFCFLFAKPFLAGWRWALLQGLRVHPQQCVSRSLGAAQPLHCCHFWGA